MYSTGRHFPHQGTFPILLIKARHTGRGWLLKRSSVSRTAGAGRNAQTRNTFLLHLENCEEFYNGASPVKRVCILCPCPEDTYTHTKQTQNIRSIKNTFGLIPSSLKSCHACSLLSSSLWYTIVVLRKWKQRLSFLCSKCLFCAALHLWLTACINLILHRNKLLSTWQKLIVKGC